MILKALWSGALKPAQSVPCRCPQLLSVFPFPIIILEDRTSTAPKLRICDERQAVTPDLTVGDVVAEELDIEVPPGACVVICNHRVAGGVSESFAFAAEILYSVIVESEARNELALFDWALRSFTLTWRDSLCTDGDSVDRLCRRAIERISGWQPGDSTLQDYLRLAEPDYVEYPAEPDLAQKLKPGSDMKDFGQALIAAFPGNRQLRSCENHCH